LKLSLVVRGSLLNRNTFLLSEWFIENALQKSVAELLAKNVKPESGSRLIQTAPQNAVAAEVTMR
jgi:hypothetical protein